MYKAWEKGIQNETMSIAYKIKQENPKISIDERYEIAYKKAKQLKASPTNT